MKLIFLDIDGVLNCFEKSITADLPHEEWNPETMTAFGLNLSVYKPFVDRVNKIVKHTGARIVISSSWRIGYLADWADVVIYLHNSGLQGFIVGRTPWVDANDDGYVTRGEEVNGWFAQHPNEKIDSFVILDDNPLGEKYPYEKNFVRTDHKYGIQDEHVERAIEILNEAA